MRIGIDARFYGILGKGLGRYTEKLIAALERQDDDNQYVVFLRRENFDAYQPSRPNFHKVLADYQWYSFAEQLGFVRLLYRSRLDLMHFPHFNVPILYGRPFVVTVHDLILVHHPTPRASTRHRFFYWFKFLAYRVVIRSALWRAEAVLAVSEFTREDLLAQYPFLRRKRVVTTLEAVDDFCHWQSPDEARSFFSKLFPDGILRPYLLYVGNAYPHKNLEQLILWVGASRVPDVRLVLVGRDDYFYRRLQALVVARSIGNVLFAGGADDQELGTLYHHARGYVFPSLYEGFGLPPLEAMLYGTPVLSSDMTCLLEVLGDAALFFSPASPDGSSDVVFEEQLRLLWSDESLRESLRVRGYLQARQFSWDTMARDTLAAYRDISLS